jgi:hypothetical protein
MKSDRTEYEDYASLYPYRNLSTEERGQIIQFLQIQSEDLGISREIFVEATNQIFSSLDYYMDNAGNMLDQEEELISKKISGARKEILAMLKESQKTLKLAANLQEKTDYEASALLANNAGYNPDNSLSGNFARQRVNSANSFGSADSGASGLINVINSAEEPNEEQLNQLIENFDVDGFSKLIVKISHLGNKDQLQIFEQMKIPEFCGVEKNPNSNSYTEENAISDLKAICETFTIKETLIDQLFKNKKLQTGQAPSSKFSLQKNGVLHMNGADHNTRGGNN